MSSPVIDSGDRAAGLVLAVFCHACGQSPPRKVAPLEAADWPQAVRLLGHHGLVPHAVPVLSELVDPGDLPAGLADALHGRRQRLARRHLEAQATLIEAARALGNAGVSFLALKGPALSIALYEREARRSYQDVDLLVRSRDRERAIEALAGAGYVVNGGPAIRALIRRFHFHMVAECGGAERTKIELHWSLLDRANLFRLGEEEVFSGARTVALGGVEVPVPAYAVEFLYLCLHAAKHGIRNREALRRNRPARWFCDPRNGNRLRWFVDLERYLERFGDDLDWAAMRKILGRWNAAEEVGDSLSVLKRLLPEARATKALAALGLESVEAPVGTSVAGTSSSATKRRLLERAAATNRTFTVRPVRLLQLRRLLFPAPARILRYYGRGSRLTLPLLYAKHPFHMAAKLLGLLA